MKGAAGAILVGQQKRDHQTRKTGAGPKVDPGAGCGGEAQELSRIGEVAMPDVIERRRPHEIDCLLPVPQQRFVCLQPRDCFT
jgi:hypothetical protein